MWPRPLRRRTRSHADAGPSHTRTPLRLTAEARLTASVSDTRVWYVIDVTTGGRLDSADEGHELTLPTGREVTVTAQERPSTLVWRDTHPDVGTTGSGGVMALRVWVDNSTTITITHHIDLPAGTSLRAVSARQELLDADAKAHARAWVERLGRHGAATTGND